MSRPRSLADRFHAGRLIPGLTGIAILLLGSLGAPRVAGDSFRFRLAEDSPRDLAPLLVPLRLEHHVPALGAAVVRSNTLVALGVSGFRRHGSSEPATPDDRWHHGSITKSMTASLAALLVESGTIRFETRLGEVFGDLRETMDPAWRDVTLEMLLGHRAGAPASLDGDGLWDRLWNHTGTPTESRMLLLTNLTARPPHRPPGTAYEYANAGYSLAGAMLERVTGRPWEALLRDRLFAPLGMTSAGFGVPATPRYLDEPWGHVFRNGEPVPVAPGIAADNPPAIGPGGTVHSSLRDLATFAAWHLVGESTSAVGLGRESFRRLHRPLEGQDYALGWSVLERDWAGGRVLHHTGTNTQWYTNVWLAPEIGWAFIVVTNVGDGPSGRPAFEATDAVMARLIGEFLK